MKKEMVINAVCQSLKNDLNGYYKDWEIENWTEMLDAFGQTSAECKDDIRFILRTETEKMGIDLCFDDDDEMILDDGTIYKYRQLVNDVKKCLFKK